MTFEPLDPIFLVAILGSGDRGVTLSEMMSTIDYIDHSVPTHEMIKRALERLSSAGLVTEEDGRYFPTPGTKPAKDIMNGTNNRSKWTKAADHLLETWEGEGEMCAMPTEDEYRAALNGYLSRQ